MASWGALAAAALGPLALWALRRRQRPSPATLGVRAASEHQDDQGALTMKSKERIPLVKPDGGVVDKIAAPQIGSPRVVNVRGVAPALELEVVAGPAAGATFTAGVETREVFLGRVEGNSLALLDGEVSARHAVVRYAEDARGGSWYLVDLGSLNGTMRGAQGRPPEDVWMAACPAPGHPGVGLFCVFDGHCGRGAADRAKEVIPPLVLQELAAGGGDRGAALHAAMVAAEAAIPHEHEGCTGTAVLVWRDGDGVRAQVANVGDSHCVVGELGGKATRLTANHRVSERSERERLAERGVRLRDGETRLFGLSLSRAFGDKILKAEGTGLTAEPSVSGVVDLRGKVGLAVLASDGLWDVCGAQEAIDIVTRAHAGGAGVDAMAGALLRHAQVHRSTDDITALVLLRT